MFGEFPTLGVLARGRVPLIIEALLQVARCGHMTQPQPVKCTRSGCESGARSRTVKSSLLALVGVAVAPAVFSRVLAVLTVAATSTGWPPAFLVAHIL